MKKKLVLGITSPGSTPLIKGQAAYFKSLGYEVFLMAPKGDKVTQYCHDEGCTHLSIPIVRPIRPVADIKALVHVVRALRRIKPDIVNVGTPKMGLLGMIGAKLMGTKTRIYTCRGFRYEHEKGMTRKLLMSMEKLSSSFAQKVICISSSVRDRGITDGVFAAKKAVLIGHGSSNGVDLKFFNPQNVPAKATIELKESLGITGKFVYGFVGRVMDRKGINELYEAFTIVYEQDKNAVLVIVGGITQEQVSDKNLIQKFEEHPAIYWVGFQQNVPLYMSMLDVFVLPAWWEGFGNVLIQAAAMGIPVISTDGTGCRDAFHAGFNGLVVPTKDIKMLIKAMRTYRENAHLRIEHGANGKKWAEHFPPQRIWDGLNELYANKAKH